MPACRRAPARGGEEEEEEVFLLILRALQQSISLFISIIGDR
jgi:hypothetical protein